MELRNDTELRAHSIYQLARNMGNRNMKDDQADRGAKSLGGPKLQLLIGGLVPGPIPIVAS
jgi:hypothetical protein